MIVKDGVVTLAGQPETSDVGHELVDRIRHVPGVVAVRDRLSYPPREASDPALRCPGPLPRRLTATSA